MGHITTILAVVLIGLLFQKNPLIGIFLVIFYVYFKYRTSRIFFSKLMRKAGRRNALYVKKAIDDGLEKICKTMEKFQVSTKNTHTDYIKSLEPNQTPINEGIYKN